MAKYRRVHMPEALHHQIRNYIKKSKDYQSIDQFCREATEKIIIMHNLIKQEQGGEKKKTKWKSANIPREDYIKIQSWIWTGTTLYVSVDEAIRSFIRRILDLEG